MILEYLGRNCTGYTIKLENERILKRGDVTHLYCTAYLHPRMLPANCKPWAEKDWHALSAAHGQVGVTVGLNPETGNSTRGFI